MNLVRLGRVIRALRRRRGWRQAELGHRAVCSQQAISLIECGHGDRLSVRTVNRVAAQLDAELEVLIRWHGGEIERLLDEGHAVLEAAIAAVLGEAGWDVRIEVTYAFGRERGSVDVLAFEPRTAALLVLEVKTDLLSAEATARNHDQKVRLGKQIAHERLGWRASSIGALLVLPDSRTARRRIETHRELFDRIYPDRGQDVRRWLRAPAGALRGLMYLPITKSVGARQATLARRRVAHLRPTSR